MDSDVTFKDLSDEQTAPQFEENFLADYMDVDRLPSELDSDAAYAAKVQEEEYSRNVSWMPLENRASAIRNSLDVVSCNNNIYVDDAALAAHLQAEENQNQERRGRRPLFSLGRPLRRSTHNQNFHTDEPERISISSLVNLTNERPSSSGHNNHADGYIALSSRRSVPRAQRFRGAPRLVDRINPNFQNDSTEFGPDDYEVIYRKLTYIK